MWSLYNKKGESFLEDFSGEKLEPLKFSNGKTQEDIVREIIEAIEKGNKVIFLRGKCGTGKSAIALNLARNFKKTSIVVPIKSLQEQYETDYSGRKFILKKDGKKLKISVIKGRGNFKCPFTGDKADNAFLPCTIQILEKNFEQIKKMIEMNELSMRDFRSIKDVRRMSIAPACKFYSPVLPSEKDYRALIDAKKFKYMSISEKEYALFQREKGCGYYEQYKAYSEADVLIFNSKKYLIETAMGRRPRTELDIIDECDEFLDDFAEENTINLQRLSFALSTIFPQNGEERNALMRLVQKTNYLLFEYSQPEVQKLVNTDILELISLILDNPNIADEDEDNYYNKALEIARIYEPFLEETYASFEKKADERGKESGYITLVTINLEARLKEIVNSTSALVLMSGTLHSEQVLKDIFGLDNFKIIDAEIQAPGHIVKRRTGKEVNCKYENFKSGIVSRKEYLESLSECLKKAKPPVLIHVNSFEDLPTELEKVIFNLKNIISREKLLSMQERAGEHVAKFKSGETDVLFTTKCSRGIDFPGNQCNSVIITRYPYPNIKNLFWQILRKEKPEKFREFYLDKSKRELLQKIYRAVRFKEDYVILLSPDVRVMNDFSIG